MLDARRLVLAAALIASTVLTFVLGVTDPQSGSIYPTRFLVWNLVLAWIPCLFAVAFAAARTPAGTIAAGAVWLAFLPNAPYLVTDLVHLNQRGDDLWRHILQYGFAAWTGVMLGVVSLRIVHVTIERRFGTRTGWILVVGATALCAVGVVIGRFQRFNSWDLLTNPRAVAVTTWAWVGSPITNVRSTAVALAVASFFGLAYVTIWALDGLQAHAAQ